MKTKVKPVRGRPKDDSLVARRRGEILDAATRLFAVGGYARTDVQVVANDLGVGKGTIYRYFEAKEALFLAAVDRAMHRLREVVEAAVDEHGDPLEQLAAAVRAYLAFFDAHPDCVELLILERAVFKDRKKPTYFEHRDANIGRWLDLFRGLISAGRVRAAPVEDIADTISDLLYGTIFTNHFTGRREPLESQARRILEAYFLGILSDAERVRHDRYRRRA
ncbi:MAG: TetR/AcrR family transcriptional regulator [Phycisphaerae bacterium]|nr:TetR/AcrR family transcriptional regulator [Phycisphaerae bacterium]